MKKVVLIFREDQKDSVNYRNAESLGKSWGEIFFYFEVNESKSEIVSEHYHRVIQNESEEKLISYLDAIHDNNVLLLPLIFKDKIEEYIALNQYSNSQGNKWEVVYNNFTRYLFLDAHRDLSLNLPQDTRIWVKDLIDKYGKNIILDYLNKLDNIVGLIGESIIDEYYYCSALGKVSKDPLIAFNLDESVKQLGGILAAANHVQEISGKAYLLSEINDESYQFVYNRLSSLIDANLIVEKFTSQVTKTRFIDRASNTKVFETYLMNEIRTSENAFSNALTNLIRDKRVNNLIIIDFGHGLLSLENIELLINSNISISVNAQVNAGNQGFNSISKYKGAERIFINGSELEFEARRKIKNHSELISEIAPLLSCKELYVTQGSAGILSWNQEQKVFSIPGFAPAIVDRVGAGDALLSTISILRANDVPVDISCFYGNIAGAIMVGSVGNSTTISNSSLKANANSIISSLM